MSGSEKDDLLRQIDAALARIDQGQPAAAEGDELANGEEPPASDPGTPEEQAPSRRRWGFRHFGGRTT